MFPRSNSCHQLPSAAMVFLYQLIPTNEWSISKICLCCTCVYDGDPFWDSQISQPWVFLRVALGLGKACFLARHPQLIVCERIDLAIARVKWVKYFQPIMLYINIIITVIYIDLLDFPWLRPDQGFPTRLTTLHHDYGAASTSLACHPCGKRVTSPTKNDFVPACSTSIH